MFDSSATNSVSQEVFVGASYGSKKIQSTYYIAGNMPSVDKVADDDYIAIFNCTNKDSAINPSRIDGSDVEITVGKPSSSKRYLFDVYILTGK
jgi:hypothetical protein